MCGVDIEFAHIVPRKKKGSGHIDNALPACYNCHAKIERYNKEHPKGNKYRIKELKARREQIYEEQTRHLVPKIFYHITQKPPSSEPWEFPKAAFVLSHMGDSLPVKVLITRKTFIGKRGLGAPKEGHYSGKEPWRLNPGMMHIGVIKIPDIAANSKKRLYIVIEATIIDQYEREHVLLPIGWNYNRNKGYWALVP